MVVGDKLMLFVEVTKESQKEVVPIAFGTSCGIDISADTIDTSNKMSGNWKEYLTGQLGYTVSSESMLSLKTGHLSFVTLKELMKKRTPIPFVIAKQRSLKAIFLKGKSMSKVMRLLLHCQ